MPSRAPKACTRPGCANAQPCPLHPSGRWASGAPGKTRPPGWLATRRRVLRRDRHTCAMCGAPATDVDHIVRGIEADWNLRALCAACHRARTAVQARMRP